MSLRTSVRVALVTVAIGATILASTAAAQEARRSSGHVASAPDDLRIRSVKDAIRQASAANEASPDKTTRRTLDDAQATLDGLYVEAGLVQARGRELAGAGAAIFAAPANNNLASATSTGAAPFTLFGTNVEATGEPNEVQNCGSGTKSVWWTYSPPGTGTILLTTAGSSFDTVLSVFTGTAHPLTSVNCNDDSIGFQSSLSASVTSGTTYLIRLAGWGGGEGSIQLNGTFTADPADADGDGEADASDLCPSTPADAPVDADGCSAHQLHLLALPTVDADNDGLPDQKEAALARLAGVTCGSAQANKQMQKARGFLAASLVPALWADALHPDRLAGKAVFQNEQKAAFALERAMVLGTTCDTEAAASLDDLVAVDSLLAKTAFDDATAFCAANPGTRQCWRNFREAAPALAAGNTLATANDWDAAIGNYMTAWSSSVLTGGGLVRVRAGERSEIDAATAGSDEFTELDAPTGFALAGNYPNPFNPTTTIGFRMPESAHVNLAVYDLTGRQVAELVNGILPAGRHEVGFDARDLPSGTYLYRLTTPGASSTGRMTLVK